MMLLLERYGSVLIRAGFRIRIRVKVIIRVRVRFRARVGLSL